MGHIGQILERGHTVLWSLRGDLIANSILGRASSRRSLKAAAKGDQNVCAMAWVLKPTSWALCDQPKDACRVDRRAAESVHRRFGDVLDLLEQRIRIMLIAGLIIAEDLNIDRSRRAEIQNLANHVGRQPSTYHDLRIGLSSQFPGVTFSFLPSDMVSQILNFGSPAPIDIQVLAMIRPAISIMRIACSSKSSTSPESPMHGFSTLRSTLHASLG